MEYLSLEQAREAARDHEALAALIGVPYATWSGKCHEVSKDLLDAGVFGLGRIARGWAIGVGSQHSWIVLSPNVYDRCAPVVDPTIIPWLRQHNLAGTNDPAMPGGILAGILVERLTDLSHRPHGIGSVYAAPPPVKGTGPRIRLTPVTELSSDAEDFLAKIGPLDYEGWMRLANGPMEDWPSGEIIAAMCDTPQLRAVPPIDIVGMLTDRDPLGRYLQHLD